MSTALLEAPAIDDWDESFPIEEPDLPDGYEFIGGELKERNVSGLSSFVAGRIFSRLDRHIEPLKIGWIFPEGVTYKCFSGDPEKIRRADTSFVLKSRLTRKQASSKGPFSAVPDLVVEVISPNDLSYKVDRKREDWLKAGVKLVWVVNPEIQELMAYRPDASPIRFRIGDVLTAEPVLPGFRAAMAELFEMPEDDAK